MRLVGTTVFALAGTALAAFAWLAADATGATASFSYDDVGRVSSVSYDNGTCVVYTYDANGNRTSQTITSAGPPITPTWGTGVYGCFFWTP
jgi:YD repeat-containing protein